MDLELTYWAAGFLEGEGCFLYHDTPTLTASQTLSIEPLKTCQNLFGGTIYRIDNNKSRSKGKNTQDAMRWDVSGSDAIIAMVRIYPLMSFRRKAQIENVYQEVLKRGNPRKIKDHPFETLKNLLKL